VTAARQQLLLQEARQRLASRKVSLQRCRTVLLLLLLAVVRLLLLAVARLLLLLMVLQASSSSRQRQAVAQPVGL
jgi:hypothetical protein